jgi:hypothetical protein
MPEYRIYTLDPEGHIAAPPIIVSCDTDQAAITQARDLVTSQDFEVWEGSRLVTRIKFLDV